MHSFLNFFQILFLLGGITSIIQGNIDQGISLTGCWLVCQFLNTKFIDDKIGVDKSDRVKMYVILATVVINGYLFTKNLQAQPYMINANKEQQVNYISFESQLLETVNKCTTLHNEAINKLNSYEELEHSEIEQIQDVCSDSLLNVQEQTVDDSNLPNVISLMMYETKDNYKNILSSIIMLNYIIGDEYDKSVSSVIEFNQQDAFYKLNKLRYMLSLESLGEENKNTIELIK